MQGRKYPNPYGKENGYLSSCKCNFFKRNGNQSTQKCGGQKWVEIAATDNVYAPRRDDTWPYTCDPLHCSKSKILLCLAKILYGDNTPTEKHCKKYHFKDPIFGLRPNMSDEQIKQKNRRIANVRKRKEQNQEDHQECNIHFLRQFQALQIKTESKENDPDCPCNSFATKDVSIEPTKTKAQGTELILCSNPSDCLRCNKCEKNRIDSNILLENKYDCPMNMKSDYINFMKENNCDSSVQQGSDAKREEPIAESARELQPNQNNSEIDSVVFLHEHKVKRRGKRQKKHMKTDAYSCEANKNKDSSDNFANIRNIVSKSKEKYLKASNIVDTNTKELLPYLKHDANNFLNSEAYREATSRILQIESYIKALNALISNYDPIISPYSPITRQYLATKTYKHYKLIKSKKFSPVPQCFCLPRLVFRNKPYLEGLVTSEGKHVTRNQYRSCVCGKRKQNDTIKYNMKNHIYNWTGRLMICRQASRISCPVKDFKI